MKPKIFTYFIMIYVSAFTMPAFSAMYVIHPDGSGDFPTIQAAIDNASDEDIIALSDGVFTGPGNRNIDPGGKASIIRSRSGQAVACVIDIQGAFSGISEQGFYIHSGDGPETEIRDMTIMHGVADGR